MPKSNLPHSTEIEQALLGDILVHPGDIVLVIDKVHEDMFFFERHRVIWRAMMRLYEKGIPPDLVAVTEELKAGNELLGAGGATYLAGLVDQQSPNLDYLVEVLRQKYTRRQLVLAAKKIVGLALDEDGNLSEQAAEAERLIFDATNCEAEEKFKSIGEVAEEFWSYVYGSRGKGAIGVLTGLNKLDLAIGGFQAGDVIVVAARPGQGKTALALQISYNVAKKGRPVAFFSLEMSSQQLANRLLVALGGFSNYAIRQRSLLQAEWDAGFQIVEQLKHIPLLVDDQAELTTTQIRARAKRMKAERKDLALIVIDYLQLLADRPPYKGASRSETVGMIARRCKYLAKELEVPVLLLSQLNRKVEDRADKEPTLADLRESGEIEQVADVVMFVYAPEEQGDRREIIIAKQRMLPPGRVKGLRFKNAWFEEVDASEDEEKDLGIEISPLHDHAKEISNLFGGEE